MSRKHRASTLLAPVVCVLLGCAGEAANLVPTQVPDGDGAIFGRVEVSNLGQPVTENCYATFTDSADEVKAHVSLDRSGWVFTTTEPGPTLLGRIICTLGGFIKYNSAFATDAVRFHVPGSGRIAYFGHVRIDMNDDGDAQVTGTLIGGAIGALVGAAMSTGPQRELEIANELPAALREYRRRFGRASLALKVVDARGGPPATAVPLPRSTNPNLLVEGADLGGGLQLVWLGVPRTNAEKVGLRLLRHAPQAELAQCKQLGLVIDGVHSRHALAYKATPGPHGLREALQAETELATVKAIVGAKRVQIELCGLGRKLPPHAQSAGQRFVAGFERRIPRPPVSLPQSASEPAAVRDPAQGPDAGVVNGDAVPTRAEAEAL
jgi:hypothetical protein